MPLRATDISDHTDASFTLGAADAPWEGIGPGWFYSVLGGGKDLRRFTTMPRVPVTFDNTAEERMRGDYPVPTVFNGDFDVVTSPDTVLENFVNSTNAIPGWSLHNSGASVPVSAPMSMMAMSATPPSSTSVLSNRRVELSALATTHPILGDYLTRIGSTGVDNNALEIRPGEHAVHNFQYVPEEGMLRFDLFVPSPADADDQTSFVRVFLNNQELPSVDPLQNNVTSVSPLAPLDESNYSPNVSRPAADLRLAVLDPILAQEAFHVQGQFNRIGYGERGFETFYVNVPNHLRKKIGNIKFEVHGLTTVFIDNVAFGSEHVKFGSPTLDGQKARVDKVNSGNNYLVEKPQYVLSYNAATKNANWVSWQLNNSWLGTRPRPPYFAEDITLPPTFSSTLSPKPIPANYSSSIFTQGHLTPSSDRNRSSKDIASTYILSNAIPQDSSVNNGAWSLLENHVKAYTTSNGRESYNIAGGIEFIDPSERAAYRALLATDSIVMAGIETPEFFWRVALVLERPGIQVDQITDTSSGLIKDVIAVKMPNDVFYPTFTPAQTQWEYWRTSVDEIESLTGLDLLANLPDNVENAIEAINPGQTTSALYP